MMKIGLRDKFIAISIFSILILLFIWMPISMNWSEKTCAKILYIERSRGYHVWFTYNRNGLDVKDHMPLGSFNRKTIDELRMKECCDIKYSIYWPYKVEIIDKELKAE
jgi:hypothetical protein